MTASYQVLLEPNGGSFECREDQTVLEAAIAAGYWLPHSCRAGTCASCLVPVRGGEFSHGRPEFPLPAGSCMTCQARPHSDLVLEAPNLPKEPGLRVVQGPARVLDVSRPSDDVVIVRAQLPAASGFRFIPGQYAEVILRDGSRRSYSMANLPDDAGTIEWHIRKMPGGRFSGHAHANLKPRDMLRVEGPFGTFRLHEGDAPIIFLASGTGFAPIASILAAHHEEIVRRGARLYWGGRVPADLYAFDAVQAWQERASGLRFIPVLSEADGAWAGRSGYVHQAVLDDFDSLAGHEVYACGNPLMIEAARASFVADRGLPAERFYSDAFIAR